MANEKRLIDADACLHDMCKRCNIENEGCPCEPADCFIYNVLENQTTVDAVEVVRCKDCKHYKTQKKSAHWNNSTPYCCRCTVVKVNPNDFCSYGERKADG